MSGLSKSQMTALLATVKANPEFALQQAFRFGLLPVNTEAANKSIKRAMEILEHDAESIKEAYDGAWTSEEKENYAERKKVAKQLRDMITNAPKSE